MTSSALSIKMHTLTRTSRSRDWFIIVLFALSAFLYSIRFEDVGGGSTTFDISNDAYDPRIGEIRSLAGLEDAARHRIVKTGNDKRDLALALTKVVELHTVHGVARQTWRQNWIANSLDSLAFMDASFAGKMLPEELVKENIAFCSQASQILQELFRRNGILQATVRFNVGGVPPHSAVAAKPDGVWRYYDPSLEPTEEGIPFDSLMAPGKFLELYAAEKWRSKGVDQKFENLARDGKIAIIDIDGQGPLRGIAFQRLTTILSVHGWTVPMLIAIWLLYRRGRKDRAHYPSPKSL